MKCFVFCLSLAFLPQAWGQSKCSDLFPDSLLEMGFNLSTLEYWRQSGLSESTLLLDRFLTFLRTRPDSFFTQLALFAAVKDDMSFDHIVEDKALREYLLSFAGPESQDALKQRVVQIYQLQQYFAIDDDHEHDHLLEAPSLGLLARLMIDLAPPQAMSRDESTLSDRRFTILKAAMAEYQNPPPLSRLFVESNGYAHKLLLSLASAAEEPSASDFSKLTRALATLGLHADRLSRLNRELVFQLLEPFLKEADYEFEVVTLIQTLNEQYALHLLPQFGGAVAVQSIRQVLSEMDGIRDEQVRLFLEVLIASDLLGRPVLGARQMALQLKQAFEKYVRTLDRRTRSEFH